MPDDTTKTSAIVPAEPQTQIAPRGNSTDMLADPAMFGQMQRVARMFSESQLVPQHLRGKLADCFIALHIARRLNEDPLTLMQHIYIVSGKAGWEAKYMIARANKSGLLKGRIKWRTEGEGDGLEVTAYAILAEDGDEIDAMASMKMAKAEQWTKNPKYASMPEMMLRYRSATMLIRLYLPDVMLGLPSAQELQEGGELVEQQDGSYAPAAPARADFQKPASKHPDEKADNSTASEGGDDQPDPYELVDCDGEAKPYQRAGDYANALEKVFDEAARRGADVLEGMWETNSPTFGRLRGEERIDLVDRLTEHYAALRDAPKDTPAKAEPDQPPKGDDGPPPGHPASGEMF